MPWASQLVLVVKNSPANAGDIRDRSWSLGWEDPLEEGMATHPNILAWRIPVDRGAWRATVHGVAQSWTWMNQLSTQAGPQRGMQIKESVSLPYPTHCNWENGSLESAKLGWHPGDILWRSSLPVGRIWHAISAGQRWVWQQRRGRIGQSPSLGWHCSTRHWATAAAASSAEKVESKSCERWTAWLHSL